MKKESYIHLGNLIMIVASFLVVALLVVLMERKAQYWHLFIIPILLSAFTYNLGGGLAVWFLSTGFMTWYMIYSKYPPGRIDVLIDGLLGLGLAIGLGIYAKNIKRTKSLLEKLSRRDSLTGLENYSCFVNRLTEEKNRSDRYETPFSLILMDIDYFKRFNDSYGHEAGNEVLKKIAETIHAHIRSVDLGARYGGEEFAAILTNADSVGALKFAKRLHGAIGKLSFNFAGGKQNIAVSVGVATYPKDARSETELIVYADQALYQAKAEGRNRVCVYSTPRTICSLSKILG